MNKNSQLYEISQQKLSFFEVLLRQFRFKGESGTEQTSLEERFRRICEPIESTLADIQRRHENLPRLLNDLKSSLDTVNCLLYR